MCRSQVFFLGMKCRPGGAANGHSGLCGGERVSECESGEWWEMS